MYRSPEEIPIPKGTDPIESLLRVLSRADGVLSCIVKDNGTISGQLAGNAVDAAISMVRQANALVNYWWELEKTERIESKLEVK